MAFWITSKAFFDLDVAVTLRQRLSLPIKPKRRERAGPGRRTANPGWVYQERAALALIDESSRRQGRAGESRQGEERKEKSIHARVELPFVGSSSAHWNPRDA
jgi:hypothetical protein